MSTTTNLTNINFMSKERYESLQNVSDNELYAVKLNDGDLVSPDNLSITTNSNESIQAIGVINQANSTEAIKVWTGTKNEYDELVESEEIDSNTIYNIIDEDTIESRVTHNIGDIFYSMRTEDILNGAVVCDGSTYNIADYASGDQSVRNLLRDGKLPYVPLETYSSTITSKGVCRCFGYDANGETFRVPTLTDVFIETGTAESSNEKIDSGLPNITGQITGGLATQSGNMGKSGAFDDSTLADLESIYAYRLDGAHTPFITKFNASDSNSIYGNSDTVQPDAVKYRAFVQLATDTTDSALQTVSSVLSDVAELQDQMEETVNYGNITNCITEIPQDIKLELNNGTLTLKAGSKVYVPNGSGVFDEVTIDSDITIGNQDWSSATGIVYYRTDGASIAIYPLGNIESGPSSTLTYTYRMWYDTTNNVIKTTNDSGSTWYQRGASLPIAIVRWTKDGTYDTVISIDQIFNGFGYIGNTVFALPGVKGLIPNGRNPDGTLNNTLTEVTSVITKSYAGTEQKLYWGIVDNTIYYQTQSLVNYNENKNTTNWKTAIIAKGEVSNSTITQFIPKTSFHALDYNDSGTLSGWSMPGSRFVNLTLGASGNSYTAPANGWFYINKGGTNGSEFVYIHNSTYGICMNNMSSSAATFIFPAKSGDVVTIDYTSTGTTYGFTFIYAEGEVK